MNLTKPIATALLLLALAACGTAGSGVAADMLNPQAPQAGSPFPYNSPWCN